MTFLLPRLDLVVKIPRIPLVVLVAAVLGGGLLPLGVVPHVVLEDAGEGHGGQHAHHWRQGQHQAHHHAGKVDGTDGVQGDWRGKQSRVEWAGRRGCVEKRRADKGQTRRMTM